MKTMTCKERIDAALARQPVDRIPVSFWRHFYQNEDTPRGLADAMLLFYENYKWDFLKINPRASYHHEDWGARYEFFKDGYSKPRRLDYPVRKLQDLDKIEPLKPLKAPVLSGHLDSVNMIKKGLGGKVYFIMTVFSPMSIVADMCPGLDEFGEYLMEDPVLVEKAVEAVTVTFEEFTTELLNAGVSGLFYATTHWGNYDRLNDAQFERFSRPFDMRLLKLVSHCPLNVLHVCKSNNMLEKLADYPVGAFSWDTEDHTNPRLDEGVEIVKPRAVIGGIDHKKAMSAMDSEVVISQANRALEQTRGLGWILGAGCTYSPGVPLDNLKALREWVEKVPAGKK